MSNDLDTDVLPRRIAAQVVDLVLTYAFLIGAGVAAQFVLFGDDFLFAYTSSAGPAPGATAGTDLLLLLVVTLGVSLVFASYGFVLEYVWDGRTVGKYLFGIRVVGTDGSPPSVAAVIARNLPILVVAIVVPPFSHVLPLLVGLVAILLSEEDQRLFDMLAGTYVVAD